IPPEAKRPLDNSVIVVKGTSLNDVRSSASVTIKALRTFVSLRMESRTPGATSWRKTISGDSGASRMLLRISLARTTGRGEKALMFHDTRENAGVVVLSTLPGERDVGIALLEGIGIQRWVEWLK